MRAGKVLAFGARVEGRDGSGREAGFVADQQWGVQERWGLFGLGEGWYPSVR